jgi:hypothetical protein
MPSISEMKFIVDIIPKNNAEKVSLNSPISIKFGRDINQSTINGAFFVARVRHGARINGTITYQAKTAVAVPATKLDPGETYQVTLLGDHGPTTPCIKDIVGNDMPQDFLSTFQTTKDVGLASPLLIAPVDDSFLSDDTPKFSFEQVAGANHYEIYMSDLTLDNVLWNTMIYPTVDNLENNIISVTYKPLTEGEYHWKVRAWGGDTAYGAWSETRKFALRTAQPQQPTDPTDPVGEIVSVVEIQPSDASYEITPNSIIITLSTDIDPLTVTDQTVVILGEPIE